MKGCPMAHYWRHWMNLKSDFYYALLKDNDNDSFLIQPVLKETWDSERMLDDPDDISEYIEKFKLSGYTFEISGMNGEACLDIIERYDGEDVDGQQLLEDLINSGFDINEDFANYLAYESDGLFDSILP